MSADQNGASWVALRYPTFRAMYFSEFVLNIGASLKLAAVGWHIWTLTQDEFALGLVGLVRVVPIVVLALIGGVIADAINRRRLLLTAHLAAFVLSGVLAAATLSGSISVALIYAITALLAGMTAFETPARAALLPTLVPKEHLADAVRVNSMMFPVTTVVGPVLAGLLIAAGDIGFTYLLAAFSALPAILVLRRLRNLPAQVGSGLRDVNFKAMREGLSFVWRTPALRASMLLDFFATFFSSALALLPIYADEILRVGAAGYGVLSAAPSVGSIIGATVMAQLGSRARRQGEIMLIAVGLYGLATIIFGVSQNFVISLLALATTGLTDAVSMMIRSTMRQLLTPDRLRGRMLSVNMIFFMGGPQLGEFEAGVVASLTSASFSVVSGGVGTVMVVALMALTVPALRRYSEAPAQTEVAPRPAPQPASD